MQFAQLCHPFFSKTDGLDLCLSPARLIGNIIFELVLYRLRLFSLVLTSLICLHRPWRKRHPQKPLVSGI